MVGWHHQVNGHDFEPTPGNSEGQGSLVFCCPCSHKELDTTYQRLNNHKMTTKVERHEGQDLGEEKESTERGVTFGNAFLLEAF